MPIDTSIYNALMQPRSVEDYAAQYDRQDMRKQAMQQNALMLQAGQQKQADYTRGLQDEDAIRNALSGLGAGATDDQRINALRGTGLPAGYTRADALQKTLTERDKGSADAAKSRAEAASKNGALFKQYAGILTQSPTQQTAQYLLAHYEQESGQPADNIRAIIQQAGENPDALRKIGAALSMEADKLLPTNQTVNTGGAQVTQSIDRLTGVPTQTGSMPILQSADSRASQGTAAARLAEDKRQFGITQAAATEQRTFDRAKPQPGALPANQKIKDAQEAIDIINQAVPLLEGSTSGYGGYVVDQLARAFSVSTPGAINAQKLKALEGVLVSKMPKMSGPQSDKDVALYRQMAAEIGDPTIPYQQKAAALDSVREIQERYAGMVPGSSVPAKPGVRDTAPAAQNGGVVEWGSLK